MSKSSIWAIVLLVGGYIICQLIADVAATKIVQVGSVIMPAGTFVFAFTFTLRDLLHKRLGKQWARATIIASGLFNIFMAGYLALAALLHVPVFFQLGDAWNAIFAIVPAITLGSIFAEVISELVDTEIYHAWRKHFNKLPQWSAVLVSNVVSLPLDSFLFAVAAFVILPPLFGAESMPMSVAWSIVVGQILWKAVVTGISLPAIYLVKDEKIAELQGSRAE